MPNFDKTGPAGKGAKTGGQMGDCEGAQEQGRPLDGRGQGQGRGMGQGQGRGRGAGRGFWSRLGFGRGRGGRQQ